MALDETKLQLRWLTPPEGGRSLLPQGPTYFTTARFVDDPAEQLFSVALGFSQEEDGDLGTKQASLSLLFPELLPQVIHRLTPGARLLITEGRRVVAEGLVQSDVVEAAGLT